MGEKEKAVLKRNEVPEGSQQEVGFSRLSLRCDAGLDDRSSAAVLSTATRCYRSRSRLQQVYRTEPLYAFVPPSMAVPAQPMRLCGSR